MPNWENYYADDLSQQQYEEWRRECERQNCIMEQMIQDEIERVEERKRYPLFFWKEMCKKENV